ncbi:MAG: phosphotransferase, partial [Pseudomonadota bacterium]
MSLAEPSMHADEFAIDTSLVRRLVARQFPQYAHLEVNRLTASGSSNMMFRLGHELLVRLPRQPGGGAAIGKEHRWSTYLRQQLPVAVPEIVAVGQADEEYGEHFSIVRWQMGVHPAVFGSQDFANHAQRLRAE